MDVVGGSLPVLDTDVVAADPAVGTPAPVIVGVDFNGVPMRIDAAQDIFRQVRGGSAPLEELAKAVTVPVLLQWGEDDRVVDVSGAHALREAFADVETRLQPGVGHLPMLETPRESLRLFLDSHRRRGLSTGNKA